MSKRAFSKIKLATIIAIGAIVAGATYIYQKLFGGEIQSLPQDKSAMNQIQKSSNTQKQIVAVAHAETPAQGIQAVVAQTGNFDFIEPGQKVLIKPNVNSDDPAPGTTHPEALAEVVRLAKSKGAYVIVGDRSNPRWKTIDAMKKTGMYKAALDAEADEIISFDDSEWIRVKPEGAKNWSKGFRIPKIITEVDHIISVPVLHTHHITSHSLALKNLVGLIHPTDRLIFHASKKTEEMIAEISLAIKPAMTIIDGTKSFIDGGPSKGTVSDSKVYLASGDIMAAEVTGVELLKREGAKLFWDDAWKSKQVQRAMELNLSSLSKTEIEAESKDI